MDDYNGRAVRGGDAAFQFRADRGVGFRPNVRENRFCSEGTHGATWLQT